jgi:predicted RNase H-like HicB family nuclease
VTSESKIDPQKDVSAVAVKSYKVHYELDETGWWVASIAAVPGCHTQGRTLEQAEERIREALALFVSDKAAASAKLVREVALPPAAKKALAESSAKRAKAELLAKEAQHSTLIAAKTLVDTGLSLRDVGAMLGVSRQRAHQLVEESDRVLVGASKAKSYSRLRAAPRSKRSQSA